MWREVRTLSLGWSSRGSCSENFGVMTLGPREEKFAEGEVPGPDLRMSHQPQLHRHEQPSFRTQPHIWPSDRTPDTSEMDAYRWHSVVYNIVRRFVTCLRPYHMMEFMWNSSFLLDFVSFSRASRNLTTSLGLSHVTWPFSAASSRRFCPASPALPRTPAMRAMHRRLSPLADSS